MLKFKKDTETEKIFNLYSEDVLNYSLSLLKDRGEAEDTVQEVFIKYLAGKNSFRQECSIKTWLMTITRNHCYNKITRKPRNIVKIDSVKDPSYSSKIEEKIIVNEALAALSAEEYELLHLKDFALFSYAEIAEILGISQENARIRVFRIREKLRSLLK